MITATFAHLADLSSDDLRHLLAMIDRLRTDSSRESPAVRTFIDACWMALDAEDQRRWEALVARSQQRSRPPELQPARGLVAQR